MVASSICGECLTMEFFNGKTIFITDDFKIVISNIQLNTSIFLVNKNSKFAHFEVDKWTEFKKSISDIDDEFTKRTNCQHPDLYLIQGKSLIITGDLKVIVSNWKTSTTIFIVNNEGDYHYAYLDSDMWKEFKNRINDIDAEFSKRFKYQYSNL